MLPTSWFRTLSIQWPQLCLLGVVLSITGIGAAPAQDLDPGSGDVHDPQTPLTQSQFYDDGSDPSISPQDAAIAFALAQGIQDPETIVRFVNEILRVDPPVTLGQVLGRDTDLLAISDFDCDGDAGTVTDAAILYGMTAGMGTWAEVEEYLSQELQIPMTLGEGCAWPGGDPVEIPQSAVVIRDAEQLDGTPLTIGETLTLEALAGDEQGQNISDQIQWFDSQGQLLGTGPRLLYQAQEVRMETVTARLSPASPEPTHLFNFGAEAQASEARISFTISRENAILAAGVKVLPDEAKDAIQSLDYEAGSMTLTKVEGLPTIQVGDVLVGAAFRVQPSRVIALEDRSDLLELQIELAMPKDVIRYGVIREWQEARVDPEGNVILLEPRGGGVRLADECRHPVQGGINLPVVESPSTTLGIEIPNPWPNFFRQVEAQVTTSLDVQAVAEASLCLVYGLPEIVFSEEGKLFSGIERFQMAAGFEDLAASAYLEMNGLYEWGIIKRIPEEPKKLLGSPPFLIGQLGPVFVWMSLDLLGHVRVESGVALSAHSKLGMEYSGGKLIAEISYHDVGESGEWDFSHDFAPGSFSPILEGDLDLDGFVQVGVNPEVEVKLWGSIPPVKPLPLFTLPKIGTNLYVRAELELLPDDVVVEVSQPQSGGTYAGNEEITIQAKASGDPELTFLAGVDLTLRDGSVEEPQCHVPVSASAQERTILQANSLNLRRLSGHNITIFKEWLINGEYGLDSDSAVEDYKDFYATSNASEFDIYYDANNPQKRIYILRKGESSDCAIETEETWEEVLEWWRDYQQ